MYTRAVAGVAPAAYDAEVLAAIAASSRRAARGPTTVIGIRNTDGGLYRVVHATGVAESIALTGALEDLGLIDDHLEFDRAREGCDCIYQVPGLRRIDSTFGGLNAAAYRVASPALSAAPASLPAAAPPPARPASR
ncbi:MAG TPA: hypothetical protein VGP22_17355 [Albitalea sp.]|jgi:hypothetical protein|nr:hypothetical protein [Albitalea sp.]